MAVTELARRIGLSVDDSPAKAWKPKRVKRTREQIDADKRASVALSLAMRAKQAQEGILERYRWDFMDIMESSPLHIEGGRAQAIALLGLFDPNDTVWCGEKEDSIAKDKVDEYEADKRKHARLRSVRRCFRPALRWIDFAKTSIDVMPGPRVCACVFKPVDAQGRPATARSLEQVARARFLVVEHDHLTLDEQGAHLRWLREACKLRLRAVVFTGGKSLHGWFDAPNAIKVSKLRTMLCGVQRDEIVDSRPVKVTEGGMGFDQAIFNPVQPWKLPGWPHPKTGKPVELVWVSADGADLRGKEAR